MDSDSITVEFKDNNNLAEDNANEEINTVSDSAEEQQPARQRGRPKKYDAEREKKITLYLTAEMFNFIKTVANVKNISMTDYAVNILEQDIMKKKPVLEQLLALQESL